MEIFNIYQIDAARRLPCLPESHPCSRVHGHTFQVEVFVEGELGEESGWVMDFADLDAAFSPIREALDHRYLNDISGLENPTTERLAQWIWERLKPAVSGLSRIVVRETPRSGCVYSG